MIGIATFGAYVPRLRLQRAAMARATSWFNPALKGLGAGERAMANWDEDALTMAVEACRACLSELDRGGIAKLFLASTTLPFADRQNAGIVKEALLLSDAVGTLDVAGSQRAGTSALIAALDRSTSGPALCVAAEHRRAAAASAAEFTNGDAAAALVIDDHNVVAAFLGAHTSAVDFIDHFRAPDHAHDYEWESRWIRDEGYAKIIAPAVSEALAKLDLAAGAVDHFLIAAPVGGFARAIAAQIGVRPEALGDSLHDRLGYAGAAHPLVMLTHALETAEPGQIIVVVGFGQGCDVLVFRTTPLLAEARHALGVSFWLARRKEETNYIKFLHFMGELNLDGGMRAELDLKTPPSMLYRDRKTILGLVGGRCRETGAVQYPKSRVSVAQNARMVDTQDDYPLADLRAQVVTFTADQLGYSPDPPNCYGLIDFDGGGRMMADFTEVEDGGLPVGAPVRMMFRIKRTDIRGFTHYFWKAAPDFRGA